MLIVIEGSGKWILNRVNGSLTHCFLTAIETSNAHICLLPLQEKSV
jgi:hypothetical protein